MRNTKKRPSTVTIRVAAALLACVALAAACTSADSDRSAIQVQAIDVQGEPIVYEDLADSDTLLWFWAPW